MKKLILIAFLFVAFIASGQPAPELLFHKTEPNPTFIKIENSSEISMITPGDWFFAYAENTVYGSNPIETAIVAAFGKDPETAGFAYNEVIKIGLYDVETRKFYEINGSVKSWMDKKPAAMKWQPLGLYLFDILNIGDEIGLIADHELSEVKLTIEANTDTVKPGEKVFLKVLAKNTGDPFVMAQGNGTIEEVKRWLSGFGWVTHIYTPADDDKTVFINAAALSNFTKGMATAQHQITVESKVTKPGEPAGDGVIYENVEYGFKLEKRTRGAMELIYLIPNDQFEYRLIMSRSNGSKSLNAGNIPAGGSKLITPIEMNGVATTELQFQFINKKRVNFKIEL
jgi:hypothetical protein